MPGPTTRSEAPIVARQYKEFPIYIVSTDDTSGVVEAIVNVFGIVDLGLDRVWNGSYTKTLLERGQQVKVRVLDQHQTDSAMRVIGKPLDVREVGRDELPDKVKADHPTATGGLYTKTQYLLSDPIGKGIYERLRDGYLDEYSIGFDVLGKPDYSTEVIDGQKVQVRNIRQLRLWEYSVVIWGMNQATATTSVKALTDPQLVADAQQKELVDGFPVRRLGDKLEVRLRDAFGYASNSLLECGYITSEQRSALDGAFTAGLATFVAQMPEDVARIDLTPQQIDIWDLLYYEAAGPADQKSGRVLSAKNSAAIKDATSKAKDAVEQLESVLMSAGALDVESESDDTMAKAADAPASPVQDAQDSTGPSSSSSIVPPDLDVLSLDLSALQLDLELMAHGPRPDA